MPWWQYEPEDKFTAHMRAAQELEDRVTERAGAAGMLIFGGALAGICAAIFTLLSRQWALGAVLMLAFTGIAWIGGLMLPKSSRQRPSA